MPNKVLIFGIDSFTGKYLSDKLISENFQIEGTTLNIKDKNYCDITSKSDCSRILNNTKPDYIINLAGLSFVPNSDVNKIYNVNFLGIVNIMKSLITLGLFPKKILFASSAQLYSKYDKEKIKEDFIISPRNHYANSKFAMENCLNWYKDDFNINIVRPFNYTGLGQNLKFIVPKMIWHFKQKMKNINLGDINVSRDFSDVRDVASAYVCVLKNANKSEVFNICSGNSISIQDLINIISKLTKHKLNVIEDEKFKRSNLIRDLKGDNSKLLSIGWKPDFVNFENTLQWMINGNN